MTARQTVYPRIRGDERGMALALALIAIVVIGALVGGAFASGRLEIGSARASLYATQAQQQAEMAITEAMINWDTRWNTMPTDSVWDGAVTTSGANRRVFTVTRLGANLLEVRGLGERLDASGNRIGIRQIARLVRLTHPTISIQAAVTATGNVTVGGNAEVTGNDEDPAGWTSCSGALDTLGGVRTTGTVGVGGSASVTGDPAEIENDSTVTNALFTTPFNMLMPLRNITIPGTGTTSLNGMAPAVTGTPAYCDRANTANWGEPNRGVGHVAECINYFPIIYTAGTLRVQDGRGQGVLLVTGNLELRGNFIFDGLVIVLGEVKTNGTGNKITGAVLASNATIGDLTSFIGDPQIAFSSCAVFSALSNSARGDYLNDRSWVQIY